MLVKARPCGILKRQDGLVAVSAQTSSQGFSTTRVFGSMVHNYAICLHIYIEILMNESLFILLRFKLISCRKHDR